MIINDLHTPEHKLALGDHNEAICLDCPHVRKMMVVMEAISMAEREGIELHLETDEEKEAWYDKLMDEHQELEEPF